MTFQMLIFGLLYVALPVNAVTNVVLEQFGSELNHKWIVVNDPVMGGLSSGKIDIHDGKGIFEGVVKDVPSLDSPGFISMRTSGGYFPDLRSCDGLVLDVQSSNSYNGFHVGFGLNYAGSMRYVHGYKAHFDAPVGSFGEVYIPFDQFSDNWDPKTGDQIVTCQENNEYCPDDETLRNLQRLEIMGEGVSGEVNLQIQSIQARGCADDVVETDPNPEETAKKNIPSLSSTSIILPNGDVQIESFSDPHHTWEALNDPVMGGSSTSKVDVFKDEGLAIFDGEVVDVSFLNAPGFISMQTQQEYFPDISMCHAIKINLKSKNKYEGLRVSFGTHHAENAMPYVSGYKTHVLDLPTDDFGDIILNFSDFSDNWDPYTGDVLVSCADNSKHCPDIDTLKNLGRFSIMGEGIDGKVHLSINSIVATDCEHASSTAITSNNSFTSNGSNGSHTKGVYMNKASWAGVFIGFVVLAGIAFIMGRRSGHRASFIQPAEVTLQGNPSSDIC